MTEDGRRFGMAAFSGRCLSLLRGWGHQDAQLDAVTNSLWLLSAIEPARALSPCFEVETPIASSQVSDHPNGEGLSLGAPAARPGAPAIVVSHPWRDEAAPRMGHPQCFVIVKVRIFRGDLS